MNDVPLLVSDAVRLMAEADEVHRRHVGSFVYIYLRLVGKRWHWNIGAHIVTEHGVTVEFFQSGEAQGYRDRTVAELAGYSCAVEAVGAAAICGCEWETMPAAE